MKGVLFRRTVVLVMIIMLLAGILVLGAYSVFGRKAFIGLEMDRLGSVLNTASEVYASQEGLFTRSAFAGSLQFLANTAGLKYYYFYPETGSRLGGYTNITEYDNSYLMSVQQQILSGENVSTTSLVLGNGVKAIAAGMPLYNVFGKVEAGVLFIMEIQAVDSAFAKLNSALWLLVFITVPLMLVAAVTGVRRVNRPIEEMTKVAISVAKGDYEVRADESQPGEMGIFARAMNRMSGTLSQTIYQLDSEKRQLWSMLSSFTDGVAALDDTGNLTHFNPALMKMFGAVEVKNPLDLVPDAAVWDTFRTVLDTREAHTMQYELPGEKYLVITIVPVMAEDGECRGVVGLFKDVTEFEKLENMRKDYIANISHELRTPLTAVRGLLEPLSDGMVKDEETRRKYYGIMLHETERLSRLITDMLQLSRLESGTEYMEKKVFELNELLEDVMENYMRTAEKKKIRLELDAAEEEAKVLSDPDRIEQMLVILLDNAMRYAGEDGTVRVSLRRGESGFEVSVWDSGCGIAPGDIGHVFERFYKGDKSRREGGTGLGLSIAKQIAGKLGETIGVESELGQWTCFTFTVSEYLSNAIPLGPADISNAILYEGGEENRASKNTEENGEAAYEVVEEPEKKPASKSRRRSFRMLHKNQPPSH